MKIGVDYHDVSANEAFIANLYLSVGTNCRATHAGALSDADL
ncbi:hypothetical protein [Stenotrophomonas maltophilia]